VVPLERTEPPVVCLDADVLIAGLLSTSGASHALLVLGEVGLLAIVVPRAAVAETTKNLRALLPEALPAFERFLAAMAVHVQDPAARDLRAAEALAHPKDVPILAAALSARARILVTHNTRHFRPSGRLRVVRPRVLLEEARAWMSQLGR
jgi:predicted nucleic acid-binding protein